MLNSFLKPQAVRAQFARGRTQMHADISMGLFVKPIRIGARATAFPADEVQALFNARIAGMTDSQIRSLVESLHAARRKIA